VLDSEAGLTTYVYDAVGNLIRTELPNRTEEHRTYDALDRLVLLEHRHADTDEVLANFRYTLDAAGHRTVVEEHDGRRVEYAYDALYRLIGEETFEPGETDPARTISYTYDEVGNRLTRDDSLEGRTTYEYDDNDRLMREASVADGETTYTYDDNGNLVGTTGPTGQVAYGWDSENRLIRADMDGDGSFEVVNQYDHRGVRVSQTAGGQEVRFLVDSNRAYSQVLEEYLPGGAVEVSYVHGQDLVSQTRDGQTSYYHVDGLGSTRALTNADGVVTDRYTYDAFGQEIARSGVTDNDFLFAGEQRDTQLGLDYLRARYLDVGSGRFVSSDPYAGALHDPVSLHRYLYANAAPTIFVDPSGQQAGIGHLAVAGIVAGTLAHACYQEHGLGTVCERKTEAFVRDYNDYQGEPVPTNYYDAFGHCWVACEMSKLCGWFGTLTLGFGREICRELDKRPHDSLGPDIYNQHVGRYLAWHGLDCYLGCYAAVVGRALSLYAPTRGEREHSRAPVTGGCRDRDFGVVNCPPRDHTLATAA